jgi:hypothetical protein
MRDVVLCADRQGGVLIRGKKGLHACVKRVTRHGFARIKTSV